MAITTYEIQNGSICAEGGIPLSPRIFTDGRLSFFYNERGITEVDYFGKRRSGGNNKVFEEDVFAALRNYVTVDGKRCLPTLDKVRIEPYGVYIRFKAEGLPFTLAVVALKGQLVTALTVPKAAEGHTVTFSFDFFESNLFMPTDSSKYLDRKFGKSRVFSPITFDGKALSFSYEDKNDRYTGLTEVRIEADFPLTHIKRGVNDSIRHTLESAPLSVGIHSFRMVFDGEESLDLSAALSHQERRYRSVKQRMPRLFSENKGLDLFFALCPYYMESLKTEDYPGAVKAKNINYWIWGWDVLTYSTAYALMGDAQFLRDACAFFRDYGSGDRLIHYYDFHMDKEKIRRASDGSVVTSSLYPILLHNAYSATGDKKLLEEFYPVAKRYTNTILASEIGESGFILGRSLYPDYPDLIGETGRDISSFNHTLYYSAFRSLEVLADEVGDTEMVLTLRRFIDTMEREYVARFHDEGVGFPVTSIDADTKEKRPVFYANSVKFESAYLFDILAPVARQHLDFYKNRLVNRAGIRPLPEDDPAYDADGNQLHYWFPVTGEYYIRLANRLRDTDAVKGYADYIAYWSEKLMCPEGINCHADTKTPAMDGWTTLNASWQAFSMRPWYSGAMQSILGFIMEDGGITFSPTDIGNFRMENLTVGKHNINVTVKGKGKYLDRITVNGKTLRGTAKIPEDLLEKTNEITVYRSKTQKTALLSAHGATLTDYTEGEVTVNFRGSVTVEFSSAAPLTVTLDGKPLDVRFDGERTTVTLRAPDKNPHRLTWK